MHNKKILIVDDEEGMRLTISDFMLGLGHEPHTAESLEKALLAIDRETFDLVFLDIVLKERSGMELLKEIKARGLDVPVVMITGYPNMETVYEALTLGASDYISKPFQKSHIVHVAQKALRFSELAQSEAQYRRDLEAVFKGLAEGIVVLDDSLRVRELNPTARGLLNIQDEDVKGRPLHEIMAPCHNIALEMLAEAMKTKAPSKRLLHQCVHEGMGAVMTYSVAPLLDERGTTCGAILVVRDETRLVDPHRDVGTREVFCGLVGRHPQMQKLYTMVEALGPVPSTVLISGESGTGKSIVAHAIHDSGMRRSRPFVKVDCAALHEQLLESELFGHVRGAFTGAIADKPGRFEVANGGTIFLDEIGDISPRMQLLLLRVLQEGTFERVGDNRPRKVDVRVIAATNRDLKARMAEGAFREDLFYRLNVIELNVPALRQRASDLPLLVEHLVQKHSKRLGMQSKMPSPAAMQRIVAYHWPGNVRELENTLERALILSKGPFLDIEHFPAPANQEEHDADAHAGYKGITREALLGALQRARGNKSKAAELLGVNRRTVYRKIDEYGLVQYQDNES